MTAWQTTFLVEPWPGTPWDHRELERWQHASAQYSYATVLHRRSVRVSAVIEAEEERTAIAAGRERVDAFFPPARYTVQSPQSVPSPRSLRLLRAGALLYRNQTDPALHRDEVEKT